MVIYKRYLLTFLCFSGLSALFGIDKESLNRIEFPPDDDGLKVFGEFIYWKTTTDPFPYAVTFTNVTLPADVGGTTLPNNKEFKTVEFGYAPGFRIGALYAGGVDLWDVGITWTLFNQASTASVLVNSPEQLNTLWEPTLSPSDAAVATQNQKFANVDFELGRTWHISDHFFLRGALAAELAWLIEKLDIAYTGIINNNDYRTNSYISLYNDFSGAGGSIDIKTNYYIGYGFSFCGLGKIALYAATINIRNQQEIDIINQDTNQIQPVYLNRKNTLLNMKSNFVIDLGGEWGGQIFPMVGLKISLLYELNYWPNQVGLLQLIYDKDREAVIINQFSDVAFQGIALRGVLNF